MQKEISIFSFFSGIGILDLAFEKSGYNIVFVNEYDDLFMASYQYARTQMSHRVPLYGYHNESAECYTKKRGKRKLIDLVAQEREKGHLVGFIGGPPCPDFSVAGKNAGVVGENGRLTNAALDDGFLKIATDIKTNEEGTLGEKGIGRLATQRLGTALLVETSSVEESQTSYVFIDWNDVINGVEEVPNFEGPATPQHTRLIIFNVNLEDYIDNAMQFEQLSLDNSNVQVQINRELKSALNFLISPFDKSKETLPIPQLRFYFDDYEIDITFPYDILSLAESIHSFRFESKQNGILSYGLDIKPWFIERVHRALVKADAFNRLKKPHDFYRDMLERNSIRIENALKTTATKEELKDLFINILSDFYAVTEDEQKKEFFDSFIEKKQKRERTIFILS